MKSMLLGIFTLIFCLLSLVLTPSLPIEAIPLAEKTERFSSVGDAYTDYSKPTQNFGSGDLYISTVPILDQVYRTYLAFKVSGLPIDALVTKVELGIHVKSISDEIDTKGEFVGIAETLPFKEDTITWDNNPEYSNWYYHNLRVVWINEARYWSFQFYNEDEVLPELNSSDDSKFLIKHSVTGNGNYYFSLTSIRHNCKDNGSPCDDTIVIRSRSEYQSPKLVVTYTYTPESTGSKHETTSGDITGSLTEGTPGMGTLPLLVAIVLLSVLYERKTKV